MTIASIPASGAAAAPPRVRALRWAAGLAALVVLAVPVIPAPQGNIASAVAGIALAPLRPVSDFELQPASVVAPGSLALPPAAPFVARFGDSASALRAETCLTEAIYYEGALEPEAGQRAIAQVVLNRVRHPAYPDDVCSVVFQGQERTTGCQFTFTCDGSRARPPVPSLWARANRVARAALGGAVSSEVGLSTHYHADYVMPYWSASLDRAGRIGRHIFYRWRGANGQPAAFTDRYAGREPLIAAWVPRAPETGETRLAGGEGAPAPGPGAGASYAALVPPTVPAASVPAAAPAPAPMPFRARPLPLAGAAKQGVQ